ncbi:MULTISPECIES: type II toxin-antitoxin system HicA family toxin [unclassified Pseudomonas]|uniref:type II toxin-antitoxin system HicA family toxin n=1 Tax=unclassified Pseudomonas TaxID=196821 RepID=UPI002447E315|nr:MULTISPECIES: type II toxin-antitoxin system HicA family toxin [unclassified Pseudomonas]MDH0894654.1 type II toxin-antitoxin system HicA family toxin [Pseudomonas sp. GD03875]MDH1067296.1 type II toxin-antitoxin system HicA family toxin [Pseudomonas sp. GD03985]
MADQFSTGGRRCGRALRKNLQPLLQYAKANGWTVGATKNGHLRFTKPGRPIIHTGSTPSDWRSLRNALAALARADRMVVVELPHAVAIYHG